MIRKAYRSILRIRMRTLLQYRASALSSACVNLMWGFIRTVILILFYRWGRGDAASATLAQSVSYVWLSQCFISLMPFGVDSEISQQIATGNFAYELCRPLDLYAHWFARLAADRLAPFLMKSGLVLLIAVLLPAPYGLTAPASAAGLVTMAVTLILAVPLSCAFGMLLLINMLWIEQGAGLGPLLSQLVYVFSGTVVPLALYPDRMAAVLRLLPFAGVMDTPCALYTGMLPPDAVAGLLLRQAVWIIMLVMLGRFVLSLGLRRTVIQGG